ncbi:hypothetical protein BIV25_39575 [Streptomyces sp. MUSC 14]|uniref:hypothetical protein n=1 Tax=Streptomyces sp. MUSC 14 TaxID=1354889 RepID=UPI0008F565C3|nr:hypothetical protein [Streptomyces sp. MUSC 14]OIJ87320.1 hypothetical protein BIV25_39575 [Streptomyces sp. MUSC 14]
MNEEWGQRQHRQHAGSARTLHAVEPPAPGPADLVHELVVAAGTDGGEAPGLARRLAAALSPEVRLVLLNALAEAGASDDDRPLGPGTPGPCSLSFLPTYQDHEPDRPARAPEYGDTGFPQAARNDPPDGIVRLRFADAIAFERAGAAFATGSGPGFGDPWGDPATLTLRIPADAGVETLRAVLAVLDAAAVTAESLTVHTHELDDVFAAFTSLP